MPSRIETRIESTLIAMDSVMMVVAVLCLCCIGVITAVDVAMRYLFNSPLTFAFDLTQKYLFPFSVYFALSETYRRNENIEIDLVVRKLRDATWRRLVLLGNIAALLIFGFITYLYTGKAIDQYVAGESTFGAISWPLWPASAGVALGFGTLSAWILFRSAQHAMGTSERPAATQSLEGEIAEAVAQR